MFCKCRITASWSRCWLVASLSFESSVQLITTRGSPSSVWGRAHLSNDVPATTKDFSGTWRGTSFRPWSSRIWFHLSPALARWTWYDWAVQQGGGELGQRWISKGEGRNLVYFGACKNKGWIVLAGAVHVLREQSRRAAWPLQPHTTRSLELLTLWARMGQGKMEWCFSDLDLTN